MHFVQEDEIMLDVSNSIYSMDAMQDLVPFPLIEEEVEDFDYYLKKFPSQYKYMLAFIAEQCGTEKVDDLSVLLANSQSRYASDIWIGQEELYESLDRILTILKNDPKHKCFLQKVTAKEAPDYASIVKIPMDLGKITRNLKDGVYKSKQQFSVDLNLIVSNCLLYNQNANNIFRIYAVSLKERAEQLLRETPDIIVRHKGDLSDAELKEWSSKRAKMFLTNSSGPPLKIPEYTVNPLPNLFQIPHKEYKTNTGPRSNFFVDICLKDVQTLFQIRMNYTEIERLSDENQIQVFARQPIKIDQLDLYNSHTTSANLNAAVKQYLCLICLAVGFEQSSMAAIDLLADIVTRYISNLSKSFVKHSQRFDNSINALHCCLHENGASTALIWQYLYENYSYSRKLISVNSKLTNILGGIKNTMGDEDVFTGEDGFVAGGFINNVLEEDLFGLESIGIGNIKIPEKMLKRKANQNVLEVKDNGIYPDLPLYAAITELPPTIAIYRGFLNFLVEQEEEERQEKLAKNAPQPMTQ